MSLRVKDLELKSYATLQIDFSIGNALSALEKEDLDYGVIKNGKDILGFVTKRDLFEAKSREKEPVHSVLKPFIGEISADSKINKLHGEWKGPLLVYDSPGNYCGILEMSSFIKTIENLHKQAKEMNAEIDAIINFSSDEIYVTDGQGKTLRVSKSFEENSGVPLKEVIGKNVKELENKGIFRPSAARLVLEQKSKVTILQEYKNKNKVLVTGTPVFEKNGTISRVIINTRDTSKLNMLKAQLEEIENLKERYYQELLNLRNDHLPGGNIVARSETMTNLLNTARKVAEVDSTVLLLGETGVGKGLLARYIHDNSPRKNNPFIIINCGAIPESLLESELFGYDPGAFTGAHRKGKIGKIELANEGTLFLDEIGDLPPTLQVKLLHVIQEGIITRIGGTREIKLNVRFIAATNRELSKMVSDGSFREDLYYRLNVVPLEIPPLRERKEDIELLTQKFLEKYNKKYRKEKSFSPEALTFLQNYGWPGNVRELENLVERLVIVINEDVIEPHHLPETIKTANIYPGSLAGEIINNLPPLEKIKEELEKEILEKLYHQFGNTYKIARLLKVNQSTVVRKLKKYNIQKEKRIEEKVNKNKNKK